MDRKQEKFFKVFVSESKDILSEVSDDLLELEKDPENIGVINTLFRHLHTLKGNASLDGFEKLTSIAHVMESIFDKARENKLTINSSMVDTLFDALDMLEQLLEGLLNEDYEKLDEHDIIDSLNDVLSYSEEYKPLPPQKSIIGGVKLSSEKRQELKTKITDSIKSYLIDLTFTNESAGALNTFIIISNLKSISEAIISSPGAEELQSITQLAKSQILILTSGSKKEIENKIISNCETSVIIEASIDKIPWEDMGLEKTVPDKFFLDEKQNQVVDKCINSQQAFIIELNFSVSDAMKNINAFIVFSNLQKPSDIVLSMPDMKEIQQGFSFSNVLILYCGEIPLIKLNDKIKLNCKDFQITQINNENKYDYIYQKDKEIVEKREKEKEKKELSKEISKNEKTDRKKASESVSIEVEKFIVEGVIENIGELVVNMNFISTLMGDIIEEDTDDIEAIKENLKLLNAQVQGTALMLNTLMDYAFVLRLVPLKPLFKKIPRIIRDSARKVGKKIKAETLGQSIRVDPDVINMLEGPVVHILRNSVDHGIELPEKRKEKGKDETGVITVKATQEHRFIVIEVIDDGGGINTEKVLEKAIEKGLVSQKEAEKMNNEDIYKLLFHPGFSTKEQASELSGRGVGMDVVLYEMEKIGGTIEVESERDKGSTFRLKFPVNF